MEYNWTEQDIEEDLKKIKSKLNGKNPREKNYYLKVINYVNCALKAKQLPSSNIALTKQEKVNKIAEEFYINERLYPLIEMFRKKQEKYDLIMESIISEIDTEKSLKYINHEEALTIVHDFFKETDAEIFKYFLKIYKSRYEQIKFVEEESLIDCMGGCCLFIDIVKKNYIMIGDYKGISKTSIIAHEIGHAIASLYKSRHMYNTKDHFLDELESFFFELAFLELAAPKIDKYGAARESFLTLYRQSDDAKNLVLHRQIITTLEDYEYKLNKDSFHELRRKNLEKQDIIDSLDTNIEDYGIYVISYIVALELLQIYKQDKVSALQILKKMISMRNKDSLEVIETFFKEFNNIESGIITINNNMQKQLKI